MIAGLASVPAAADWLQTLVDAMPVLVLLVT
jgi:hypothetical protein